MKRRIISLLMALALVFTLLPAGALADDSVSGDTGSVDMEEIIAAVEKLINEGGSSPDLSSILEGLDYNQLAQLVAALLSDKVDISPVLDRLDVNELVGVVKGLIAGDADLVAILEKLDTDQLVALITELLGDNETLAPILEQLDIGQLADVIKTLIAGDQDISSVLENLDTDQLVALITGLLGDNETLAPILEQLDIGQLVTVIKALIAGDQDISSVIAQLDTDQLVALITGLLGDNETLAPILEQLDVDQLVTVIKALIAGDQDISSIIAQLEPYQILKVISGLIGSELDVVGPKNVTVTETEDAVFSVKVNLSLLDQLNGITYKYMWLEPSELKDLNDVNFENLDVLSLIVRISGKSLGNGETFTVQDTTMRDDGRKFVCVIYNVSEKVFYVTDEATLTVTPFSDCTHNTLRSVRGLEPTCTEDGHIAYYECATCGKLFLDKECITQTNRNDIVIPALGHSPVETKAAVEPTCTETGLTAEIVCSVCGEVLKAQKTVPALGHTPVEGKAAVAPTCTETGLTAEIVCGVCGEVLKAQKTVPALGHTKVVDIEAVEPTCTKAGLTEGSHCSVCGEILSISEVVPAKGHSFEGIQCTVCGEYVPFPFKDVPKGYWCRSEVEYVWKHGLMKGVTEDTFAPTANMTRAMFATVLYRMKGCPSVEGLSEPFTDVGKDYWAYDAIVWAYNVGVTTGVTDTTFEPGRNITRAQLVTMLYRYENSPAISGALTFVDSADIAVPYRAAVLWATRNGVVNGYIDGTFRPNNNASRGHMAAIFARYCLM